MASDKTDFTKRVARIERQKTLMAENGARAKKGKDGLVEYVPKGGTMGFRFPWRALVILGVFLFAGKVGIFRALGPEAYTQKLSALEEGTQIDQVGAVIMQVDPATQWVSDQIDRFL